MKIGDSVKFTVFGEWREGKIEEFLTDQIVRINANGLSFFRNLKFHEVVLNG